MTHKQHLFVVYLAVAFAALTGYAIGWHGGEIEGVRLAHEEHDAQLSENDKQMQRIGVCRYAHAVLEDNKFCKGN